MSKKLQSIIWLIIAIIAIALIGFISYKAVIANTQKIENPTITFSIDGYGDVTIKLYPEYAPNTVKNIIALAKAGYYDGKIIYGKDDFSEYWGRNAEGNVDAPQLSTIDSSIEKDSDKDYKYSIKGEFSFNGFEQNTLSHKKGIVSMVRADYTKQIGNLVEESYNSADSQFTIMVKNSTELNGRYAAFGEVVEGMDIVEKIYETDIKTETEEAENPTVEEIKRFETNPVISKTTVKISGDESEYGLPETEKAFDYSNYLYQLMSRYSAEQ